MSMPADFDYEFSRRTLLELAERIFEHLGLDEHFGSFETLLFDWEGELDRCVEDLELGEAGW